MELSTIKYRSIFKALIFCQLPQNHSLQGYLQLTFPSLVDPPHSESRCSPPHVGPSHCKKCGSTSFRISLSCRSATFFTLQLLQLPKSCQQWELTFLSTIDFSATKILSTVGVNNPVNSGSRHSCQPQLSELPKIWKTLCYLSTIGIDNVAFRSYQNPVNSGS